jgi:hypothetical protein
MTTKQQAYDHPLYLAVGSTPTGQLNGSAGTSTKFAAFLDMKIKSITLRATTAGTSADVVSLVQVSGTVTTTTPYGTVTTGGATLGQNLTPASAASQAALSQGDLWYVQKGTDATATFVGAVEYVIQPSAATTL